VITSIFCYIAVNLRVKLKFDDTLDAYSVHGVGGTIGALLTGVFATTTVNELGDNGLLYGNPAQLWEQFVGVIATYAFAGIGTFLLLKLVGLFTSLRVQPTIEEIQGIDISEHGEEAYGEG
jgi:Amt family ammonium transporter